MDKAKPQRNSAVELLRILAMLFIVCSHCRLHAGFPDADSKLFLNNILLDWCVLGNLGVDIFMLISGYFLCDNLHYSRSRSAVSLLSQVWFYSILGLGIYWITGHSLTLGTLLPSIFPTVFSQYWFFTAYFVLIFFLPYINMVINKLDRIQLLSLIGTMLFFWCIIPTFAHQEMGGGVLCQFLMFYNIGAYFKKYPDTILKKKKNRYLLTAVSALLMFASSVVLRFVFGKYMQYFYARQSLLAVGFAVGLFAISIYRKSFCNPWINKIAGCTFGVYLLHDHPLMRGIIWQEWLPKNRFYDSYLLIAAIVLSVLIVMSAGTVVELIRQATVKKPMENFLGIVFRKVQNFFKSCRMKMSKAALLH